MTNHIVGRLKTPLEDENCDILESKNWELSLHLFLKLITSRMVTVVELLLTCICLMALMILWMYFNGAREKQHSGNERKATSADCASSAKQPVTREPWMVKTENVVSNLNDKLREIPTNMRIFSHAMRSLYAEKQISSEVETADEFISLRDDTKLDALVYVTGILPVSVKLVRSISEFFDLYQSLQNKETWINHLPQVIEEVKGYKQCCKEVVRLHKDIMTPLKEKEDRAKVMLEKMGNLTKVYEEKRKELEQKSVDRRDMGKSIAQIPILNMFVAPFLFIGADLAAAEATAAKFQITINESATLAVGNTMIPALASFINGIEIAAGFFAIIEQELTTFQERGQKASADAMELHFLTMKGKAKEIKESCRSFFAVVPAVKSDFSCIPATRSDKNYVDEWLEEQKEKIRMKYKHNITKNLRQMITSLAQSNRLEIMAPCEADSE